MFKKEIDELRQKLSDIIYWITHATNFQAHNTAQIETIISLLKDICEELHELNERER